MRATAQDVEKAYQLILGREPDTSSAINFHVAIERSAWELARDFANSEEFIGKVGSRSAFSVMKIVDRDYLAKNFTLPQKMSCFLHHYDAMFNLLSQDSFINLAHDSLELIVHELDGFVYRLEAQWSRSIIHEGEISLVLTVNRAPLYVLSFTIIPRELIDGADGSVFLISRLQGYKGMNYYLTSICNIFGNVPAQLILIAALEGIAIASRVECLVGVGAINQVSGAAPEYNLVKNYDTVFRSLGSPAETGSNFFPVTLPRTARDLRDVPASHRARARRRREKRQALATHCHDMWVSWS